MPEIFPTYNMSFDELLHGAFREAEGLSFIYQSDIFVKLIEHYKDYNAYLIENKNSRSVKKFIKDIKKKDGIIWASNKSPVLFEALCSAHLSALCELFNNGYLNENILDFSSLTHTINQQLSPDKDNAQAIKKRANSLDQLDGVRTMQILRSLALITIETANIRQISIGAGAATKDIVALHALPEINRKIDKASGQRSLHFSMSKQNTTNIIVSDIDPQRKDFYEKLTDNKEYGDIIGLNIDTYDALARLPALDREKNTGTRNLFVALRIDHRMLPDIKEFFKLIYCCMDQTADLVITMGSGFTVEDFQGRVDKIQEIFDYLNKLKLEPVLIKLHDQGNIHTQRATNKFSKASITTYQILHCKLKKKILSKMI